MDNKLPNLVNLNEDPQLSEMLLYMLKEGEKTFNLGDCFSQLQTLAQILTGGDVIFLSFDSVPKVR